MDTLLQDVRSVRRLAGQRGSSRLLESFQYGFGADDAWTFVAAPVALVTVALVACWLPGRRAARMHPMDAQRVE